MKKITFCTSERYSVYIGKEPNSFIKELNSAVCGKVCIISDEKVSSLYLGTVKNLMIEKNIRFFTVKGGEKSKSIKTYSYIMNFLAENNFTREDTVIALGGGVVGDLVGFVASTYMRGINFINIPTSLLAMIDSSVGGKTAINLSRGKNLCGTFYQPRAVFIATSFLKTLGIREIKSGMGELLKYTFLDKEEKFDLSDLNGELVAKCLKIKKRIVEEDEKEREKRKLLNFGHTFGHAIERAENFRISHGECVAKGIYYALIISKNYYGKDGNSVEEYVRLAKRFNIDVTSGYDVDVLIENITADKKRSGDLISFILIDKDRLPQIVSIGIKDIKGYISR